jgi:hypothetical protein
VFHRNSDGACSVEHCCLEANDLIEDGVEWDQF